MAKVKTEDTKGKSKTKRPLNRKVEENLPQSAGPKYSLIDEIKNTPYYGKAVSRNDARARDFIKEHIEVTGSGKIVPGQLILFDYFEPKTKDDLEFYDSSPMTIFFNVVNTKEGKRVLGFNIHYYPPKMRYQIMNTIFNIFKPIYSKYFTNGPTKTVEAFDYQYLIDSLEKAGLGFGVRMYIPNLIHDVHVIPPQMWHVAVFTEGWFKKQTRAAIMKYWTKWKNTH